MNFMEFSGLTRIASARELNHPPQPQVVSEVGTSVASAIASFVAAVVAPNGWGNTPRE